MAKNVLWKYWDTQLQQWVEIHPITKTANVVDDSGVSVDEKLNNYENEQTSLQDQLDNHENTIATQTKYGHIRASVTSFNTLLGVNASSTDYYSVAIGANSTAARSAVAVGDTAVANGDYSVGIGFWVRANNDKEGVLGNSNYTNKWKVEGSLSTTGTKNFEIPHPKPEKTATHVIRHSAVESPTAGDTLYRWKITAEKENDVVTINLPDYFIWLNKDVQIFVTPQGHFGNGYGVLNEETEQLEIHCQFAGEYNILVIGTRNDNHESVQNWDIRGVEREVGESWYGETYAFEVIEFMEIEEIKEV